MSKPVEVIILVEGPTEKNFVVQVLGKYLAMKDVYATPIVLSKPGQKGGDVRFARAIKDIGLHLKQRRDTWLTLLVDYYGIRSDWPGYHESKQEHRHTLKAQIMNRATADAVNTLFSGQDAARRFIPYVSMFEFEALLFSDPKILSEKIGASQKDIDMILSRCGEPEKINDDPKTAPSTRLESLSDKKFKKTVSGIDIAKAIGIPKMRKACPLFDAWLERIETLPG